MRSDVDDTDSRKYQRRQALGRAWLQPDRAAEFARQGKLDLQTLVDYLSTDEGAAEAEAAALELRRSGDFIGQRSAEQMELLLDMIEKQIREDGVSVTAAAKLLDTLFKITGIAAARATKAQENAGVGKPRFSITFNLNSQDKTKPSGITITTVESPAPVGRLLDAIHKPFAGDDAVEACESEMDADHE